MYIRLAAQCRHPCSGRKAGVFAAAYRQLRTGGLTAVEFRLLKSALRWLESQLPLPKRTENGALFWFKGESNPCTKRIWKLA
jgi:hypothetical protein